MGQQNSLFSISKSSLAETIIIEQNINFYKIFAGKSKDKCSSCFSLLGQAETMKFFTIS